MNTPDAILKLSHLKIQNANAISSPLTWGFPAVTAVLGFVHALQRKIHKSYPDLKFDGVAIICHHCSPQIYQANAWSDATFKLTRNPIEKDGKTASIQEEGRVHIEISLLIATSAEKCLGNDDNKANVLEDIEKLLPTLRLAGGSILPSTKKTKNVWLDWPESPEQVKKILYRLLPGFTLLNRAELLKKHTAKLQEKNPQAAALEALMDFASIHYQSTVVQANTEQAEWIVKKNHDEKGWLVPIPIGYRAISELYAPGKVLNTRDNTSPCQFVESVYSLGEWRSPHRLNNLEHLFWHYQADTGNGLYLCNNNFQESFDN